MKNIISNVVMDMVKGISLEFQLDTYENHDGGLTTKYTNDLVELYIILVNPDDVNYKEIYDSIRNKVEELKADESFEEKELFYCDLGNLRIHFSSETNHNVTKEAAVDLLTDLYKFMRAYL